MENAPLFYQKQQYSKLSTNEGLDILQNKTATIVGAGGLGCPCLEILSSAGIGAINIIDGDTIEESNLARQTLYSFQDIGKNKATIATQYINKKNPSIQCIAHTEFLTPNNTKLLLDKSDIIIDATDNIGTRYLINDTCKENKTPFIYGTIHNNEGFVSTFNYKADIDYRDLFPKPPTTNISDCNEIGANTSLTQIIGNLQGEEALKTLFGIPELDGKLLIFNIESYKTTFLKIPKNNTKEPAKESDYINMHCTPTSDIGLNEIDSLELKHPNLIKIDVRNKMGQSPFDKQVHIPIQMLDKIPDQYTNEHPILVYCEKGINSKIAAQKLTQEYGFKNVFNLKGGVRAYPSV